MNKGWYLARDWNGIVLDNISVVGRRGTMRNGQGISRAAWDCACKCGKSFVLTSNLLHQKEVRSKRGVIAYCTMFCKLRS